MQQETVSGMKYALFICSCLLIGFSGYAQNLVPNPGFEQYDRCPDGSGEIRSPLTSSPYPLQSVSKWISAVEVSSPDYYNGCSGNNYSSVPSNFFGYHPANSGFGYTGIVTFASSNTDPPSYFLEYIEVELVAPLLADSFYEVSCYVKPVFRREPLTGFATVAVDGIGVMFGDTTILSSQMPVPGVPVKLSQPGGAFLNDTTAWVKVSGTFKAKGGERWLVLGGTFTGYKPTLSHLYPVPPQPTTHYHSYYLIDDVSVTKTTPCDTFISIHDTNLCRQGMLPAILSSPAPDSFSFRWNTGDTTRTLVINSDGIYTCIATDGCTAYIDSFRVRARQDTMRNKPFRSMRFCEGGEQTVTTTLESDAYVWSTGEKTRSIVVNKASIYTCYTQFAECIVLAEDWHVFELPSPYKLERPLYDTVICKGEEVNLGRDFHIEGLSYGWNTGDTTCCITTDKGGTYTLTISTGECGSINDTATIGIKDCEACLFMPNAFTPNNDRLNDYFKPVLYCGIENFTIRIYNRFGEEVYMSQDPHKGWNGLHGASLADVGTYFYYLEYTVVATGQRKSMKGDLSLIR